MTERIGLQGFFDTGPFDAGVGRYLSGLARATGATQLFSAGFNVIDQVITGFLRRIGSDINRALFRFADDMIEAAVKGSALETSLDSLQASLAAVSKASLAPLVNELSGLVDEAAPAFLGFVQFAEQNFTQLANNAEIWGQSVVNQFAQGIWDAIGSVIDALSGIADAVAYWLSPGSPPRILPDIDQWGTDAANEWLGGWSKGNFGVFNDLSSTLTNLINSLPVPKGGELGVIDRILGTREGIAQAVEELRNAGTVSAATMDAIIGQVGTADANVRAYLDSLIHLEAANQVVADAQDALNKVTKEYDDLLKPVEDRLAGLSEAATQFDEDQQKANLAKVLLDPGATAAQKRRAQMEIERIDAERAKRALLAQKAVEVDAAQNALDAAKEGQSAAADEFDAKKASLALLAEQNKLLARQMELIERLNNPPPAPGGGGGVKPPKPATGKGGGGFGKLFDPKPFKWEDFVPANILEKLKELQTAFETAWGKIVAALQPAIDVWDNEVRPAWDRLVAAVLDKVPAMEVEIGRLVAFIVTEMGVTLPPIFENVASSLDSLTNIWTNHGETVIKIIGFAFRAVVATIAGTLVIISGIVALALNSLSGTFDLWSKLLQGNWAGAWEVVRTTVSTAMEIIRRTIEGVLNAALALVDLKLSDIQRAWSGAFAAMQLVIDTVMPYIETAVRTVVENVRAVIEEKITAAKAIIDTTLTTLQTSWDTFWDAAALKVKTQVEAVRAAIDEKIKAAEQIITTAFTNIRDNVIQPVIDKFDLLKLGLTQIWDWLQTHVFSFHIDLPQIPDWAIPGSPTPMEIGLRGISAALREVNAVASSALSASPANSQSISTSNSYERHYHLNVSTALQSQGVRQDFRIMEAMEPY